MSGAAVVPAAGAAGAREAALTPRQRLAREVVCAPAVAPAPQAGCARRVARVKLCGMSRPHDVEAANRAAPDLCGFVIDVPRSRRSVAAEGVAALTAGLDPTLPAVGVFVDEPLERVLALVRAGAIDAVQLHGHEDDAYVARLRAASAVAVIQAFRVREPGDVERARHSGADLVLLDNGQGTGERFDWSLVRDVGRPFALAGGLAPDNVAEAVRTLAPGGDLWGVDMSSGVETDGLKDEDKMIAATAAVRSALL